MKLRTEMQDGCVHARGGCVDEDAASLDVATDLVHDAAAAHALLRAINFIDASVPQDSAEAKARRIAIDGIWRMANARMREWGFGEAEDMEGEGT